MLIKRALLFLILLMLVFPALQRRFQLIPEKPLSGLFSSVSKPAFTLSSFRSGAYQDQYRQYREDSAGFKPSLVRLYNQIEFSLFAIPHAEKVIVGKSHELFASGYIRGFLGQDFPGEHYIDEKVRMLKFVQDLLWREKRIFVVVVIPPDKGSFYPELIPERFLEMKRHQTGRDYFTKKARSEGVNVIDFNPFFMAMKDTSRYRLIPPSGVHWSDWGSYLAADSAIRYFEKGSGLELPRMVLDSIVVTMHPRHNDDDINKTMNLLKDAPHGPLAYPCFHFVADSTKPKPAALFVADSFVWGWYDQPIIQGLFRNREIWYYDKDVFPESFTKAKATREVGLREAVERQNFLVLLQVGAGSGNPGSGVIDRLYAEYDTSAGNQIRQLEKRIFADSTWLSVEKKKAKDNNYSVEEVVRTDAINMFNDELRKKK